MLFTNTIFADQTKIFKTTPTSIFISQFDNTPFNSTLTYPRNLWAPGKVTSAKFKVYLSDDLSTNFPPSFDAPVEFSQLVSVTDGGSSATGLPLEAEVFPSAFDPGFGALPITTAMRVGIESATILPSASGALYFNLDVTALLNSSNTGSLNFSLLAPDKFKDIYSTDPDPLYALAYGLITQAISDANNGNLGPTGPYSTEDPYLVIEDYIYHYAELTVTYQAANGDPLTLNIPTLSEWAMMLLMLSLAGFAAKRLKQT